MSRFPSGVTIVTTRDAGGEAYGFTASSFCSVSRDPALVLVCLARNASCYPVFATSSRIAVSILPESRVDLALKFASKRADKFVGGGFTLTPLDSLVVADALASVECVVDSRHEAGDHMILVGRVERVSTEGRGRPAVYLERGFTGVSPE
ncbi:flavin reductase family protein [Nocardiopsis nanhaiensis]